MDQILIGKLISKKRREKEMTQAELACRLGVSDKTVSKWERGVCMPDYSMLEPLASELGLSVSALIGGEETADAPIPDSEEPKSPPDTYCGKYCSECEYRVELDCPGCINGAGQVGGICEIARCCRDKDINCCSECSFCAPCRIRRGRGKAPLEHRRQMIEEQEAEIALADDAAYIAKWLRVLLWLIIPRVILALLAGNASKTFSVIRIVGTAAVFTAQIIVFIKLSRVNGRFRMAALFSSFSAVFGIVLSALNAFDAGVLQSVLLCIDIIASAVGLASDYYEFGAHAKLMYDYDYELSEKWRRLWILDIVSVALVAGSIPTVTVAAPLALLFAVAGAALMFAVSILKLIYIYRAASFLGSYGE